MAIDLRTIRDRIRVDVRDMDAPKNSFNVVEIDSTLASQYLLLQSLLPAPVLYTASGLTLSALSNSFTLPATVAQWTGNDGQAEYAGEVKIQIARTGQWLFKLSQAEMDSYHAGASAVSFPYSQASYFDLREGKTQSVSGRLWPGTKDAEACNLWVTMNADDVRDYIGAGTDDMDDVQVQFSRIAAEALQRYTASALLRKLSEEGLKLRGFDRASANATIQGWMSEAALLRYKEAERRHNTIDTGRTERWVA